MKKLLLLLVLIFTIQITVAQPPEVFVDNWYLHSFTFNGEEISINELEITHGPTMIINEDFTLHGSGFCNDYNGTFEYIDSDPFGVPDIFIPRNIERETENCGNLQEMENHFFIPFLEEKQADILFLEVIGNEKHLLLQCYGFGYQEYKNFPALEISRIPIKDFIIFPNPVQNKLIIQSATVDFNSISISDMNGRVVNSLKNTVSNEIDVSNLQSGMYFLIIQSSEGKLTKKFIKN